MVDKKKKAKKTVTQKQKQKQSVVVNVNMTKPATRRRTLAKKTHDNRPLPPTPQAYGIPVQQSLQPSLNNITEYLKQKEGQENNRHVNILAAMKAIQRDEGAQATAVQSERADPQPAVGRKKGSTKSEEEKQQARERREVKAAAKFAADLEAQSQPTATSKLESQYQPGPTRDPMAVSFNPED